MERIFLDEGQGGDKLSLIIGIDPSFGRKEDDKKPLEKKKYGTGIILLKDGKIEKQVFLPTPSTDSIYKRVKTIQNTIRAQCEEMPDLFVIEGVSFASSGQTALQMGYLQFSIREHILYVLGQGFIDVSPLQLKKFALGKGSGDKNLILKEVYKRWGYDTDNDNLADAFVLAKTGEAYLNYPDVKLPDFQLEVIQVLKGDKPAKKTRKKVK